MSIFSLFCLGIRLGSRTDHRNQQGCQKSACKIC